MKNEVKLKRLIIKLIITIILVLTIFSALSWLEYKMYTKNYNAKLNGIMEKLEEEYPNLKKSDVLQILNSKSSASLFLEYNIKPDDSLILANDKLYFSFLIINCGFFLLIFFLIFFFIFKYHQAKEKDIKELTHYLKQINQKNYNLDISKISEDELSILKQEIYKTTVMLKESAENSLQDKKNLKKYLEDISHQIKTPLTSILIILDNLMDKDQMAKETYQEFIKDAKREVTNINNLISSLLTLSQFDVNAISYEPKKVKVSTLLETSLKNVLPLFDLKNINLEIKGNVNIKINCDLRYQKQALTNILKNSVEHSNYGGTIKITYKENHIYTKLVIENTGQEIPKKDIPHVFERFYQGENAKEGSSGIGLALAKTIINKDNGTIMVESFQGKTKFVIKYYKF